MALGMGSQLSSGTPEQTKYQNGVDVRRNKRLGCCTFLRTHTGGDQPPLTLQSKSRQSCQIHSMRWSHWTTACDGNWGMEVDCNGRFFHETHSCFHGATTRVAIATMVDNQPAALVREMLPSPLALPLALPLAYWHAQCVVQLSKESWY